MPAFTALTPEQQDALRDWLIVQFDAEDVDFDPISVGQWMFDNVHRLSEWYDQNH